MPDTVVGIETVMARKVQAFSAHASQLPFHRRERWVERHLRLWNTGRDPSRWPRLVELFRPEVL